MESRGGGLAGGWRWRPSVLTRPLLQLACTAVAILLHYFFLSTLAWLLVQGLHLHRVQAEPRNVDRGAMRFYHALGWGVPAVLLGETPHRRPRAPAPAQPSGDPSLSPYATSLGGPALLAILPSHPWRFGDSKTRPFCPGLPAPRPCRRPGP